MTETRFTKPLVEGQMTDLDADGTLVLLCKVEGEYHAIDGICSHGNVPLSFGRLSGTTVTCPLHGAQFDVRSGRCLTGPSKMDLKRFKTRIEDDVVLIATDGDV